NLRCEAREKRAEPTQGKQAPRKLKVMVLEGTPYQRGLIHGKTMKDQIHQLVRLWKAQLADVFKTDADVFIKRFAKQTEYVAAMKKWTPDLLEEVKGIAEGAGIDYETMLVFQFGDECAGEAITGERCSSLGFGKTDKQPAMVAQNMDIESYYDGFQMVLHIKHKDSDLESFALSIPGCVGLCGMNNQRIGICCNALAQVNYARKGLPVVAIVRGVLQQGTEKEAVAFLQRVEHASGQNYVIAGPEYVYSFECSANQIKPFQPEGRKDIVWHTNHPLANDDYNAAYRALREEKEHEKLEANTWARMQCLEKHLTKDSPVRDLNLIKKALAAKDSTDHPVSRPKG
ncbi:MAG: C45 family autoproteolytic acyltransferase/hydrolase, partial [Terriglobia bacterium]